MMESDEIYKLFFRIKDSHSPIILFHVCDNIVKDLSKKNLLIGLIRAFCARNAVLLLAFSENGVLAIDDYFLEEIFKDIPKIPSGAAHYVLINKDHLILHIPYKKVQDLEKNHNNDKFRISILKNEVFYNIMGQLLADPRITFIKI